MCETCQNDEVRIVLSREKKYFRYSPGDKVEGKIVVQNTQAVLDSEIRVYLETIVKVNFRDGDGRSISASENALFPNVYICIWPGKWCSTRISGKFCDARQMCLPPGFKHSFSFSFYYPLTPPLPGTFISEYGSVTHQIAAYRMTPKKTHLVASHPLHFDDFLNLFQDVWALKPLKFEKRKKSKIPWSQSSPLQFTLSMSQRGYLAGEYATFKLTLVNLTGKSLSCVVVSLIQKISYNAQKHKKTLGTVLDETETVEVDSAMETIWESGFYIPQPLKPTFNKGGIEHQYFIKVQIFSRGNTRPSLKGHIPIIIGTTREIGGHAVYREGGISSSQRHGAIRRADLLRRRSSVDELWSGLETPERFSSPPPRYSQLSSRAASIDNFLPLYEEAMRGHSSKSSEAGSGSGRKSQKKKSLEQSQIVFKN